MNHKCPKCRAVVQRQNQVIYPCTKFSEGRCRVTFSCANCGHQRSYEAPIPIGFGGSYEGGGYQRSYEEGGGGGGDCCGGC